MIEFALTDFLNLPAGIRSNFDFGQVVSSLRLTNRSYVPIKIYFRDTATTFNATPIILLPDITRDFPFPLQDFDVEPVKNGKLQIIGFLGTDPTVGPIPPIFFTFATSTPFFLFSLELNDKLMRITVIITTPFDGTKAMSIGFPANNSEIAPANKINLKKLGSKTFYPFRLSAINETLTAYFPGTSNVGAGFICIELLEV